VIFDGLRVTFAGATSGDTDDAGAAAATARVEVDEGAGVAVPSDLELCEHAASTPAQINEEPITE
jgi:hypothetical protein